MLKKLLTDPLAAFIVLGALVFAFYYHVEETSVDVVELSDINRKVFVEQFELLTGRAASAQDKQRIEADYIQEEILFREAIKAGMHLSDPEVRSKLIEEMRYQITGAFAEPEETELVSYYLDHIDRYNVEPSYSLQHVYFEKQPTNSQTILTKLVAGESVQDDEFWRGRVLPDYGYSMIRGMFGEAFLQQLGQHLDGNWYGPVQSQLGWHFVRVTGHTGQQPLSFDQAKMQVTKDYSIGLLQKAVDAYIAKLSDQYQIIRHTGG